MMEGACVRRCVYLMFVSDSLVPACVRACVQGWRNELHVHEILCGWGDSVGWCCDEQCGWMGECVTMGHDVLGEMVDVCVPVC